MILNKTPETILALGAHPDDIELGCGGSVAKFVAQGVHVRALVLTHGSVGNRRGLDRVKETRKALAKLGVEDIHVEDFPDTKLYEHLTDIITCVERHAFDLKPDRVYTMFDRDRHQDHRTVFQASDVACRNVRQIFGYETPSSWVHFQPQVFEEIGDYVEMKVAALALHKSQKDRPYTQPDAMRAIAVSHGQRVSVKAAEAFIPYKLVF